MTLIHFIINISYWSTTSRFFTPLKMDTVWLDDMNAKLNDIKYPGASLGSSCWYLVRGWSGFIQGSLAGNRGGDNAKHDAFVSDDVDDDDKMITSCYDLQVYLYSYQQAVTSLPLALLGEFCSEENINEEK